MNGYGNLDEFFPLVRLTSFLFASMDERCPICLGSIDPIAMPDVCFHRFCFRCIAEWTKVTPRCPLCARLYSALVYDVDPIAKRFKKVSVLEDFLIVNNDHASQERVQVENIRKAIKDLSTSSTSATESALRRRVHLYSLGLLPVYNFRLSEIRIPRKGIDSTHKISLSKGSYLISGEALDARKMETLIQKTKLFCGRELRALVDPNGIESVKYDDAIGVITSLVVHLIETYGDLTVPSSKSNALNELKGFLFEYTERFISELMLFLKAPFTSLANFDQKVVYTKDGLIPIPDEIPKPSSQDPKPEWTQVIEVSDDDFTEYLTDHGSTKPEENQKDKFLRSNFIVIDDELDDESAVRMRPSTWTKRKRRLDDSKSSDHSKEKKFKSDKSS
jgi:hypothetical protein